MSHADNHEPWTFITNNVGVEANPYGDLPVWTDDNTESTQLEYVERLISCFGEFLRIYWKPQRILYPASGWDISLTRVFTESEIVFVDPDTRYATEIRNQVKGVVVKCMDLEDFTDIWFDFAFIANAWGERTHKKLIEHIKDWWFIVAEWAWWNQDFEAYINHPHTELVGVFDYKDWKGEISHEGLDEYKSYIGPRDIWSGGKYKKSAWLYIFQVKCT